MKRNALLLAVAMVLCTSALAQSTYKFGYDAAGITLQDTLVSGDIKTAVISGMGSGSYRNPHYGLLEMPEKVSTSLSGAQITSISFCPFITSEDTAVVVISTEIGGTPLYQQTTTVKSHEWSNVTLTTPFTIESGKHYFIGYKIGCKVKEGPIGYYYTSNVMPKSATIDPILDYVAYEKNDGTVMSGLLDTQTWTSRRQTSNLMLYAMIEGDNLPGDAISLDTISFAKGDYIHPETQQKLSATITNVGVNPVNQFYMKVDIDGETATEQDVTTLSLKSMEEKTFSMNIPTLPAGLHSVKMTIDYPNGVDNSYTGRTSMSREYLVYGDSVKKNVLLEHFTTAKCVNCIAGEETLDSLIGVARKIQPDLNIIRINHHSGFTSDIMTTSDDLAYEWFYGGTKWAPANMTDRRNFSAYGAVGYGGLSATGPVHGSKGLKLDSMLVIAHNTPSFITLKVTPSLDANRQLTVRVVGSSLYPLPQSAGKRLNVVLLEDGIKYQQASGSSVVTDYIHNYVYRTSLTGTWGEADIFTGTAIDKTYTYTLPATWDENNMKVVAFVSDYDPSNNSNCEVRQCCEASLLPTAITEVSESRGVSEGFSYNLLGQRVGKEARGITVVNGKKIQK